jgi:hypothetical protein
MRLDNANVLLTFNTRYSYLRTAAKVIRNETHERGLLGDKKRFFIISKVSFSRVKIPQ